MNNQNIFDGPGQILLFLCHPQRDFLQFWKTYWSNRNLHFTHWTNRKQRGPQRNLVDISPINVISLRPFHHKNFGKENHHHRRSLSFEIQKPEEVLIFTWNFSFLTKHLNSISWPSPFNDLTLTYLRLTLFVTHTSIQFTIFMFDTYTEHIGLKTFDLCFSI